MRRIIILIVATIAFTGGLFAQSRNSYFMEGSYFRNDLNPALAPTRGYLALPGMSGVGLNVSSNFVSIDNFLYQPVIYSTSIKSTPLEIFIVLLIVGHMGGPLAMIVAIPCYTVVRVIAFRFFRYIKAIRRLIPSEKLITDKSKD